MPNLRAAVVGIGPRGLNHLAAIDAFDDVTLAAVCDPSDESRSAAAAKYAPEASYSAVDEMLDAETLDAVIVAVPPAPERRNSAPLPPPWCEHDAGEAPRTQHC